jgi:hypothetical protein
MRVLAAFAFSLALLAGSAPVRAQSLQATAPAIEVVRTYWAVAGPPTDPCPECSNGLQANSDYRWRNRPVKYVAIAELRNRGRQAIKSVDVDFVFTDPATGVEFLRYRVRSDRRIGPGKRVEFRRSVRDAKKEKAYTPTLPDDATLERTGNTSPRLEFARVEYEDGTVWSRP